MNHLLETGYHCQGLVILPFLPVFLVLKSGKDQTLAMTYRLLPFLLLKAEIFTAHLPKLRNPPEGDGHNRNSAGVN